jgi:hypothetical protein
MGDDLAYAMPLVKVSAAITTAICILIDMSTSSCH